MALLWKMICNLGDPMSLRHPVLGARKAEGLQPRSQPRATGVRPQFTRIIIAGPFPPFFFTFSEIERLLFLRSPWLQLCLISNRTCETSDLTKNGKKWINLWGLWSNTYRAPGINWALPLAGRAGGVWHFSNERGFSEASSSQGISSNLLL